jgi:hypothetical protein
MIFEVLLVRERPERDHHGRIVLDTETLCVQAPDRRTAERYLATNYPGWEIKRLDQVERCPEDD